MNKKYNQYQIKSHGMMKYLCLAAGWIIYWKLLLK